MNRSTFLRRSTALLLTLVLMVCAALPGFAAYQMPIQTASDTESVYLFNLDTGKPILRQNSDQQRYIASLTKMMTALLFLESGKDMNAEITIPTSLTQEFKDIQNANGSTMNLRIGETVRRIDLLYGLLVASANDAASVIASDVSGGDLTAFVAQMNARAKELGCTDTTFSCVHGLYDYGNVSTAEDLAKIAAARHEPAPERADHQVHQPHAGPGVCLSPRLCPGHEDRLYYPRRPVLRHLCPAGRPHLRPRGAGQ